jgi:hypothetical protein
VKTDRDATTILGAVCLVLGCGLLGGWVLAYAIVGGIYPGDALTYLAAGERLNAGHALYALSAGDRPVHLNPPFWDVPLLYPPLIAVIWRPLAALPGESGVLLWWAGCILAIVGAIVLLGRRTPAATGIGVAACSISLMYGLTFANVDALILAALLGTWLLARSGRWEAAGAVVAIAAVVKVTPLAVCAWAIAVAPRRGTVGVLSGLAVGLIVGILGAGIQAHVDFVDIALRTQSTGTSNLSLAGLARSVGMAPELARWLPPAMAVVGLSLVVALRRRPGPAFAVAVATCVFGSPAVNLVTPIVLLAALAPLAWPWPTSASVPDAIAEEPRRRATEPDLGPSAS